ncbi:hypothetical protein OAS39_06980 [Pirellulales bacterium]|nr:hypothetical protein [Pirellulales bacterium]
MKLYSTVFLVLFASMAQAEQVAIERLRTQLDEWRRGVQFYSTYELRRGVGVSFDDAFSNRMFDGIETLASGVFCKSGDLLRISIDYGGQTAVTGIVGDDALPKGHALIVSKGSEDEVTDGDRWLVYRPRWKNMGDRAVLSRISSIAARKTSTGQWRMSPLNPLPGFNPDPFGGDAVLGTAPAFDIVSTDDVTTVTITSNAMIKERAYSQTNTIEFWTEPDKPVIRRIHRKITYDENEPYLERDVRLSDFRECPSGFVARRVVFAAQSGREDRVRVSEWISHDLGDRNPVDSDFQIKIPPTTEIVNVLNPPPQGQVRTLDILDLKVAPPQTVYRSQ